jgi:hypothetical protein
MKFSTKLLLCAVFPAVLFIVALAVGVGGLVYTKNQFARYINTEQRIHVGLIEMYAQGLQMGQALRNVVLDPSTARAYENLESARKAYDKAYAETERTSRGTAFEAGLARVPPLRTVHAQAQERTLALVKEQSPDAVKFLNSTETPAWRSLRGELLKQVDMADKARDDAELAVNRQVDRVIALSIGLAALAVLVAGGFTWYLRNTVSKELGGDPGEARNALAQIAEGNLGYPVPTTAYQGSLMHGMLRMQESLRQLVGRCAKPPTASPRRAVKSRPAARI